MIGFKRDDAYLREHYLQWLVFRSRGQRWLTLAAPLIILFGAWVVRAEPEGGQAKLSGILMIAIGAYELLLAPFFQYRRWRKTMLNGRSELPDLVVEVRDGVLVFGLDISGGGAPIGKSVRVWRGNFFYIENGSGKHIYLPDRWGARDDVQSLLKNWLGSAPR